MCGIAAIFAYQSDAPRVSRDEVIAMRDYMAARGPDGVGEWFSTDGRVGLGHRRLSIIDLSPTGAQPMFSADGSFAIIFNGEIYNYRELRVKLEQKGRRFVSQSDTEVLLQLYEEHGANMLNEVRGMFTFALWDGRKNGLFLARDPYGIKPLYYYDDGKTIRVASQVKALLVGGKIDMAPDPAGHVGYFLWGHVPEPYTLYRNTRSVPAGSTLWIDQNGKKSLTNYCNISKILREAEEREIGNSKAKSTSPNSQFDLRSSLVDTVRHHLVADVPVGVFLSAGLDSTTIAALAAEQGGVLRTVTLGFEEYKGTPQDETPLAEEVARQFETTHQTIWVTRDDFQTQRDHLFASMDQPTQDGVNTFFVSLAAKRAGLKVAMSGVGGDEMFGGYPSFSEIPRAVRALGAAPFPWLGKSFRVITHRLIDRFTSPKYAGLFEYGGTYPGAYLLRRGMFMPWELPDLLDPELVRAGWQELHPLLRLEETIDGLRQPRLKVSALESCWYMRNQLLRDSDWAGMAHSLEIRTPLVDVDLLRELSPMLAGEDPPNKRDMAQAPNSRLPSSILDRPKTGFSVPVREWMLATNPKSEIRNSKDASPARTERGLRGWAKEVYARFMNDDARKVQGHPLVFERTRSTEAVAT